MVKKQDVWNSVDLGVHPHQPYYNLEMWDFIERHQPKPTEVVVEIGSQWGEFAFGYLSRFKPLRYFAIDPWPTSALLRSWIKRMDAWVWKNAFPIRQKSADWLPFHFEKIDLLYIDGSHEIEDVQRDLDLWVPLVRSGGLLLGHDWTNRRVRRVALEFFKRRWKEKPEISNSGPDNEQAFWKVIP